MSDNGTPPLSSTTRVVVKVDDINDNGPEFEQAFYSVTIPATGNYDRAMFQVSILVLSYNIQVYEFCISQLEDHNLSRQLALKKKLFVI